MLERGVSRIGLRLAPKTAAVCVDGGRWGCRGWRSRSSKPGCAEAHYSWQAAAERPARTAASKPAARHCHPAAAQPAQADRFRDFRRVYNEERPHAALGNAIPAIHHALWPGAAIYFIQTLAGEPTGVVERQDGAWAVHYGPIELDVI
jgi:hypothetical protein